MFDVILYAPSHKDHLSFRFYKDTGQAGDLAVQVIKEIGKVWDLSGPAIIIIIILITSLFKEDNIFSARH